jgi:quercetin dioxygenase-like cupin family protein
MDKLFAQVKQKNIKVENITNHDKEGGWTQMKKVSMFEENSFKDSGLSRLLVHDSPYFKILNFNFKAGQELPLHSHDIEGQVSIAVLEGKGEFLGDNDETFPAGPGDILISEIAEPHGIKAETDMRVLVTIAPPI